ncbi:MAG: peptidase S58 family protein, partial [Chloroflexi bacterium]|nr:peptidase S58 family protein [Chloroflexota bacterium]
PGFEEGYKACLAATDKAVPEGSIGAGTGATVGKILGIEKAIKSGLGTDSQMIAGDIVVAALVVVNAVGDVVDSRNGKTIAGPRNEQNKGFLSTLDLLKQMCDWQSWAATNTTLCVVATNASLSKEQVNKLAQMAQDGFARAINPSHMMHDGDTVFALSLGDKTCDINILGSVAADVVSRAIVRAVQKAKTLGGIPSISDMVK